MNAQKLKPELDFKKAFMVFLREKGKFSFVPVNIVLPLKCGFLKIDKQGYMICRFDKKSIKYCVAQNCPRIPNAKLHILKPKAMAVIE